MSVGLENASALAGAEDEVKDAGSGKSERLNPFMGISWGLGNTAAASALACVSTQYLFFMTDFVGLSPAVAGAILAVAKASDIASDLAVGFMSDRIDTRWGRRRPWILAGAVMMALMCAVIFNLDKAPKLYAAEICTLVVLVFYFGYTCIHVPVVAMSAEIVKGYKTTGVLWAYGMFLQMIGTNLVGTTLTASLITWYGGGLHAYNGMGLTIAAIVIACGLFNFFGTSKAPRTPARDPTQIKPPPMREWISSLVGNRSLMAYVVSETVFYFSSSMIAVTMTYYMFNCVRLGQPGLAVYGFTSIFGSILGLFTALWLMKWFPKHLQAAVCAIASGCVVLTLRTFNESTTLTAMGVLSFVWGFFNLGRNQMAYSLAPDLIHADHLMTGLRREGAIASITSSIQKTTPALTTFAFSFLLASSGYIPGRHAGVQPQSAIDMIYTFNCTIPGCMMILSSAFLLLFYRLTPKRMQELEAEAAARGA